MSFSYYCCWNALFSTTWLTFWKGFWGAPNWRKQTFFYWKKTDLLEVMSSSPFHLVYILASAYSFQLGQKTLSIQCDMWKSSLNCISHFIHRIFLEMLKSKKFTKCQKKKISLSFPNALFSAFNQDLKVPLQPTTRTRARACNSFCHSASIPLLLCVLHSCPFYQRDLDLIVPNKSFFIDITSPSLLYFPSSSSPSSLHNFCFIVHCLRICFDLMLN